MARKITPQQMAFAAEVASGCTATEAARRAGYSQRTAGKYAPQLLANPRVRAEIERMQRKAEVQALGSKAELLNMWWEALTDAKAEGDRRGLADLGERWLKARGEFVEKVEQTIEQVIDLEWSEPIEPEGGADEG